MFYATVVYHKNHTLDWPISDTRHYKACKARMQ